MGVGEPSSSSLMCNADGKLLSSRSVVFKAGNKQHIGIKPDMSNWCYTTFSLTGCRWGITSLQSVRYSLLGADCSLFHGMITSRRVTADTSCLRMRAIRGIWGHNRLLAASWVVSWYCLAFELGRKSWGLNSQKGLMTCTQNKRIWQVTKSDVKERWLIVKDIELLHYLGKKCLITWDFL
jgi:hypothetical protein